MNFSKIKMVKAVSVFMVSLLDVVAQSPEERLEELGIELSPSTTSPIANYVAFRQVDNLLFLSGTISTAKGKLGEEYDKEEGYDIAKQTGIVILANLRNYCGDLSRIQQFVNVQGFVNSTTTFQEQSYVMNGFSDLMVQVFGEAGRHTRTAIGTSTLPKNSALEIALIVQLEDVVEK